MNKDLYTPFADSEYGLELEQRTRFDRFKPDFVDTEMWTRMLGNDVNNLYHMPHTYDLAKTFALYEGMNEEHTETLLETAITHDWGEAKIGDIPLPSKTADDEKREEVAYREIANELLGGVRGKELSDQTWKILSRENEYLGDRFRAIEYIGYCTTAERAGLLANRILNGIAMTGLGYMKDTNLVNKLLEMRHAVVTHNFPTLAEYVQKYPSIPDQLRDHHNV